MGVRLDGQLYVAEHVQFGGIISPFIAKLVSGALSRVLTHRGTPTSATRTPLRCGDCMNA